MILKQVTDGLGALQAGASPITMFMNDGSENLYLVVRSIDASSITKTGIFVDIAVGLGGKVQIALTKTAPEGVTSYEVRPGDVVRVSKVTMASLGSLSVDMEFNDSVWAKQIAIATQDKINDMKTYWTLAALATSLGLAAVVSGITKANVVVSGLDSDGRSEMEEIVGEASAGNGKPTNPVV